MDCKTQDTDHYHRNCIADPFISRYGGDRINYDVLSYLPDTLETVEGQDIMVDQFGMGAFSMIVVEDMELKDVAALKEKNRSS